MTKLLVRLGCWAVGTVAVAYGSAALLFPRLYAQRHPREAVAQAYLTRELGDDLSPEQRRVVEAAARHDPLLAMLTVEGERSRGAAAWEALERLPGEKPSPTLVVQRMALDAALKGKLTEQQARGFVDSTLTLWALLDDASPADAEQLLAATARLPVSEYPNAAADPSYALVVERLEPRQRATFREHQAALGPLLAMAAPEEWNGLVEKFERAEPRVSELLAEGKQGRTAAMIYMLQFDAVRALEQAGVPEREAIAFAGINAATIGQWAEHQDAGWLGSSAASPQRSTTGGSPNSNPDNQPLYSNPDNQRSTTGGSLRSTPGTPGQREPVPEQGGWAVWAAKLRSETGPDNRSLFRTASTDPAVFWLVAHDRTPDKGNSLTILRRYAGTDLPAVLLKYGKSPELLAAAIGSLMRFDNPDDANPAKRQAAARFLSRYQDDAAFRDALVEHGAVLIPALSAGGPDALAQIRANPHDIAKWVDAEGRPRKTPLWTYIPGGNIVYAIGEKVHGRTVTWGELGWAAVDTVMLVPVVGGATAGVKALIAGERSAGEALVDVSSKAGGEAATEEIVFGEASAGAAELGAQGARSGAMLEAAVESRSLLRAAGVKVVQGFVQTIRTTAALAMRYPKTALALGTATVIALFPGVGQKIEQMLVSGAGSTAKTLGQVMAALPGGVIEGLWDEIQSLAARHPLLAPVYYSLFALLILANVAVSAWLLKRLARPVYVWIVAPVLAFGRGVAAICRTLTGWALPRTAPRK